MGDGGELSIDQDWAARFFAISGPLETDELAERRCVHSPDRTLKQLCWMRRRQDRRTVGRCPSYARSGLVR